MIICLLYSHWGCSTSKVNGLLLYGYNWKTLEAKVTILVWLHCQQRSLVAAYINCPIFNSEVQLCQKHCSLFLDFAMVFQRRMKQGFSVIFLDHILLLVTGENCTRLYISWLSEPIMPNFYLEPHLHGFPVRQKSSSDRAPNVWLT